MSRCGRPPPGRFALSPDGRRLAIAVRPGSNKREPDLIEVKVITLATGATVTWTGDWAASGTGTSPGVWLLDVATGGGSLMAHSRQAVSLLNQVRLSGGGAATPHCQLDAIITPDGSAIVCGAVNAAREDLLWSNASGGVLIGVIPVKGAGGRIGVISGNQFTPLPAAGSTADTW
jgi:hypothetical protein